MITSNSNAQVKQMIQLNKKARERRKQDVFIVEGLRMFREVPRDRLVKTYVSETFWRIRSMRLFYRGFLTKW